MSSDLHSLEPFPMFVDSSRPSSPIQFSRMNDLHLLSAAGASKLRRSRLSASAKFTNYMRLRYYQYEVTFGLYVMTPGEKLALNTIVLGIFGALFYAIYIGLQPFLVRSICQLIYYITGTLSGIESICTEASCS